MATAATTVELDVELQRRVERIAEARHKSPGALISDAVEQFVSRAESLAELGITDPSSPEFKAEYRRQSAVLAEHYRQTGFEDFWEPTEEDLKGWV